MHNYSFDYRIWVYAITFAACINVWWWFNLYSCIRGNSIYIILNNSEKLSVAGFRLTIGKFFILADYINLRVFTYATQYTF